MAGRPDSRRQTSTLPCANGRSAVQDGGGRQCTGKYGKSGGWPTATPAESRAVDLRLAGGAARFTHPISLSRVTGRSLTRLPQAL